MRRAHVDALADIGRQTLRHRHDGRGDVEPLTPGVAGLAQLQHVVEEAREASSAAAARERARRVPRVHMDICSAEQKL